MGGESKVLIIGATGYIGNYVAKASAAAGHPTFVLVRTSTITDPAKTGVLDGFKELGITILEGSLEDHQTLVKALKQVDVIISTVSGDGFYLQENLLPAIKEAGTIKRFFPSEFGLDVDRVPLLPPLQGYLGLKSKFRREIEQAGIPYTYVNNIAFSKYFLAPFWQVSTNYSPPRDKVEIYGDGDGKVSFLNEEDIAAYTIKAIDDPRTLNKTFSIRPQLISPNEVVALWEKKIGHTLEKIHLTKEDMLKRIAEAADAPPLPGSPSGAPAFSMFLCIRYAMFLEAGTSIEALEASPNYAEAHELYPDYKFGTVDKYLDQFL